MVQHAELYRPLRLGEHEIRNRIVFPPTASVTGIVTPQGLDWYGRIARGGAGLIIVEGTDLELFSRVDFARGLARLAQVIREHGALPAVQLFRKAAGPDGKALSVSSDKGSRAATTAEVAAIPAEFAHAAKVSFDAGFAAVEPHGAHGFFINQFFSQITNRRNDEYGGSLANRMRLGLEIVRGVRAVTPPGVLVFYRHTPEQANGYTLAESLKFVAALESAGLDVLDVSPSSREGGPHAGLAEAFRDAVKCPIIAVGGMDDPSAACSVLARGKVDMVAICRGLIADPEWPQKVASGSVDKIVKCLGCNKKCFGNLYRGEQIACTQWDLKPKSKSQNPNSK